VPDYVSAFPVGDGTIAKEPDSDDRRRLLSRRCCEGFRMPAA
jgi:hypothetical protein